MEIWWVRAICTPLRTVLKGFSFLHAPLLTRSYHLHGGHQAEHLKRELLARIVETKTSCEALIEGKAQQLADALESSDRCPCVTISQRGREW